VGPPSSSATPWPTDRASRILQKGITEVIVNGNDIFNNNVLTVNCR
jgi:hypothetical protein